MCAKDYYVPFVRIFKGFRKEIEPLWLGKLNETRFKVGKLTLER